MYGFFSLFPVFIIIPIYIVTIKKCYFPKITKENKRDFIFTILLNPAMVYFWGAFLEVLFLKVILGSMEKRNALADILCYVLSVIFLTFLFERETRKHQQNKWLNIFVYLSFTLMFVTSSSTIVVNYSFVEAFLTTIAIPIIVHFCYYKIITKKIVLLKEYFNNTNIFILNVLPILAYIIVFFSTYIFDICIDKKTESIFHISQLGLLLLNYLIIFFEFIAYYIIFENIEDKHKIKENSEKIIKSQEQLIDAFGEVIANANRETGNHVKRVSEYSKVLARGIHLSEEETESIRVASMLHDVGKIYVPNEILDKPGKLTSDEFKVIQTHATRGGELLERMDGELIELAAVIAEQHHEKWNGTGYLGNKEEGIPLSARIVAVADVFDALVSKRCYKPGWPIEKAYNLIISESGEHFDPMIVKAFVENFEEIKEIYNNYQDQEIV